MPDCICTAGSSWYNRETESTNDKHLEKHAWLQLDVFHAVWLPSQTQNGKRNNFMNIWHEFHGPNAGYILELYEKYQQDPNSVDAATRKQFEAWQPPVELGQNGFGVRPTTGSVPAPA